MNSQKVGHLFGTIGTVYLKRKLTAAGNIMFDKRFKNSAKANLQQKKKTQNYLKYF